MADVSKTNRIRIDLPMFSLVAAALAWLAGAPVAHAHIGIAEGGTHESRSSDDGLKGSPCGTAGSTR